MKRQNYYLAAGALLCTSAAGMLSPTPRTYATDWSGLFDDNAETCIVDSYNDEEDNRPTGGAASIESINELVDFKSFKTLDCAAGRNSIENFKGISLFTNLEELVVSDNINLNTMGDNFKLPSNLKYLETEGVGSKYFDISDAINLELIYSDNYTNFKTSTFMKKNEEGDAHSIDLSGLKFLKPESDEPDLKPEIIEDPNYAFEYDESTMVVTYEKQIPDKVQVKVNFKSGGSDSDYALYNILTRGGTITYDVFSKNYATLKANKYIKENCEANDVGQYFVCTSDIYSGDSIDTDAFVKELDLTDYAVSKIETIKSTSATFTTNEDTVKKGTISSPDAEVELKLQLTSTDDKDDDKDDDKKDDENDEEDNKKSDLAVPDTGSFTISGTTVVATTAAAAITLIGTASYISRHAAKRQKSKVRFGKK